MKAVSLQSNVKSVHIFGSYSRGDADEFSDLDILVVAEDGAGKIPEQPIIQKFRSMLPKDPSLSFYGEKKLRSMFEEGHLYAWHIYLESHCIYGNVEIREIFGEPKRYNTALYDIIGLVDILIDSRKRILSHPENSIFEMGIAYVCARNIAMSASWHFADTPDFSRYSPFSIHQTPFPLSRTLYEQTMRCRMASTRGEMPMKVSSSTAIGVTDALIPWAYQVTNLVREIK